MIAEHGIPTLPWCIRFGERDDKKGERFGTLIHAEDPQFECSFYIGDKSIQATGLTIHNIETGVQLYDVKMKSSRIDRNNIYAVTNILKEGARALYDTLYLPYFRNKN